MIILPAFPALGTTWLVEADIVGGAVNVRLAEGRKGARIICWHDHGFRVALGAADSARLDRAVLMQAALDEERK